jgi:hypothetical protein
MSLNLVGIGLSGKLDFLLTSFLTSDFQPFVIDCGLLLRTISNPSSFLFVVHCCDPVAPCYIPLEAGGRVDHQALRGLFGSPALQF